MKITFLGTGSADWSPDKRSTRRDYRRHSAVLVDDCLLIDPGPTVPEALAALGKSPADIRYILNTHTHSDHYNKDTVAFLSHAPLIPFSASEERAVGPYRVTALPANHVPGKNTVHFIVSDGTHSFFYGLDGAWLMYEEFHTVKGRGVDLAILDATLGDCPGNYRIFEHNDLSMVIAIKAALAPSVGKFLITHISSQWSKPHDTLVQELAPHGIEVAYDGLEILL